MSNIYFLQALSDGYFPNLETPKGLIRSTTLDKFYHIYGLA